MSTKKSLKTSNMRIATNDFIISMHTKLKIVSEHYFVSTYLLVQLFEFLEVAGRSVSFNLLTDIQFQQFVFRSHRQLQELVACEVAHWLLL